MQNSAEQTCNERHVLDQQEAYLLVKELHHILVGRALGFQQG